MLPVLLLVVRAQVKELSELRSMQFERRGLNAPPVYEQEDSPRQSEKCTQ
jgi:hypothetical protein